MGEGLIGLSERTCLVSSYDTVSDYRNIHLHLYNTNSSERNVSYERYLFTYTQRNLLCSKELIYNERNLITSSFDVLNDIRNISYGRGYEKYNDTRNAFAKLWIEEYSIRSVFYHRTFVNNRVILYSSFYESSRTIVLKLWKTTERTCYLTVVPLTTIGSNRFAIIGEHASIFDYKNVEFLFYHNSFSFNINPLTFELFSGNINNDSGVLFENKTIVNDNIIFSNINVDDRLEYLNLPFVVWNSSKNDFDVLNLTRHSINYIKLHQYGNSNTYFIDGYIAPLRSLLYFYLVPLDNKLEYSDDIKNKVKYAERHGYLKMLILNKEYEWGKRIIYNELEYTNIKFTLYVYPEYFNKMLNFKLLYSYPFTNTVYSTILKLFK